MVASHQSSHDEAEVAQKVNGDGELAEGVELLLAAQREYCYGFVVTRRLSSNQVEYHVGSTGLYKTK